MNQPKVWALIITGIIVFLLLAPILSEIGMAALLRQLGRLALRQLIRVGGRVLTRLGNRGRGMNFGSREKLEDHFGRHGKRLGYDDIDDYLQGANDMSKRGGLERFKRPEHNPEFAGDELFYDKRTGEFLSHSKDGTIKTYMKPRNPPKYWENTTNPADPKNLPRRTL